MLYSLHILHIGSESLISDAHTSMHDQCVSRIYYYYISCIDSEAAVWLQDLTPFWRIQLKTRQHTPCNEGVCVCVCVEPWMCVFLLHQTKDIFCESINIFHFVFSCLRSLSSAGCWHQVLMSAPLLSSLALMLIICCCAVRLCTALN